MLDPKIIQELNHNALTSPERDFVLRAGKLLVRIVAPQYIARAVAAGYTDAEHEEGLRLHQLAAGGGRPLTHAFAQQDVRYVDVGSPTQSLLVRVDAFENKWFPAIRFIIRRQVPRDQRDRFAQAFFSGLEQQPLGPGAVQSVELLLKRVTDLEASDESGAQAVRDTLRARGFDREANSVRGVLSELAAHQLPDQPAELDAVFESLHAQRAAHQDLRDWYYDVTTMLRPHYNKRERIALGISRPRSGDSAADELAADAEEMLDDELAHAAE